MRLLELVHVSHDKLDALSQALAGVPLTDDAFEQLIRAGFAGTPLAKSMAETLVTEALPTLIAPDHPEYAAWQEVLIHALMLPRDRWALECLPLRMRISQEMADRSPLLMWLRDSLYCPLIVTENLWHAYLEKWREVETGVDAQAVAKAFQDSIFERGELEETVLKQLDGLVPGIEEESETWRACLHALRRHRNADRGLLDVRIALREAFSHTGMDRIAIDKVYLALAKEAGPGWNALSLEVSRAKDIHAATALLIEVARDAQPTSTANQNGLGKYNTFSNALVSLLCWPGGLRSLVDTVASVGVACEQLVTRGESSQVREVLSGITSGKGWMQPTLRVRHPPADMENGVLQTANDADFNHPPEASGIVLETEKPVTEVYHRAGYLEEQDRRTEAFLRRQELPAEALLPADPLPVVTTYVPDDADAPDQEGDWQLPRHGTSVPAEPATKRQPLCPQVDGKGILQRQVAPHHQAYPATEAYVTFAPFVDRLEQRASHETWQPNHVNGDELRHGTASVAGERRAPVQSWQVPETAKDEPTSPSTGDGRRSPPPRAEPTYLESNLPETVLPAGSAALTTGVIALADGAMRSGRPLGRRGPTFAVMSLVTNLLGRLGAALGHPLEALAGNAPGDTSQNKTSAFNTHDDLRILHDELRHQQGRLRTDKSLKGKVDLQSVFVPIGEASPLRPYVKSVADALSHLKLTLQSNGKMNYFDGLPEISSAGVALAVTWVARKIDLSKPFTISLERTGKSEALYSLRIDGQRPNGTSSFTILGDVHVRALRGYEHIFRDAERSSEDTVKDIRKLVVRDDSRVSIQSLGKLYGVDIPKKNNATSLGKAIEDMVPKAIAASMGAPESPPPPVVMVVDTANIPAPIKHAYDEGGTSDYEVIKRRIKAVTDEAYTRLVMDQAGGITPFQEPAILAGLRAAGGLSFELELWDSDGEDDTYRHRLRVNPAEPQTVPPKAQTLREYFDEAARQFGDYVVPKIRDKDGDDEGAINIDRQELALHVPSLRQSHSLQHLDRRCINAFDLRDASSLYVEPYSVEADKVAKKVFGGITGELRIANGDVWQTPTLLAAARRWLEADGTALSALPETQQAERFRAALDEVVGIYYSYSANAIYALQRLLIDRQPTEKEFLAQEICDVLKIDKANWPVIAAQPMRFDYSTGLFVFYEASANPTMLELVYDEDLRTQVGVAKDRDAAIDAITTQIASKCISPCDVSALRENVAGLFDAFSVLGLAEGVSNSRLPEGIVHPSKAFDKANDQYIDDAEDQYRKLEAERMILMSADAVRRVDTIKRSASKGHNAGGAIDFRPWLTDKERSLLDDRAKRLRDYLKVRRNGENYHDLIPGWEQAALQLKDEALLICRNAPLEFCVVVNLLDDLVEGADAKTVALDALFYFSSTLRKVASVPVQRLGALLQDGANGFALVESVEAYKQAVREGRYGDANAALSGMLMASHGLLASGASIVERTYDFSEGHGGGPGLKVAGEDESGVDGANEDEAPLIKETTGHYWTTDESGEITGRRAGRTVLRSLDNGNVLVEGGAHAIAMGHGADTVFILGGTPCRAVRTPFDTLELWPVRDLHLARERWQRISTAEGVAYERVGGAAFPRTFSGPADSGKTSRQNAVAWYDNHVSALESVTADVTGPTGQSGGMQVVHLGVLDHKYVIDRDGTPEVVEHGGHRDGKTLLIQRDGSRLLVNGLWPEWPRYGSDIQARVVGSQGLFATVEVDEAIDGLANKRTVSGVLIPTLTGGHRLVIELDAGVYYRGSLPIDVTPPMTPGARDATLQPFQVAMQRAAPTADPKRASPALWHANREYRKEAQVDFELEIFEGAKSAITAYTQNHPWVIKQQGMIRKMLQTEPPVFPPHVRDIKSPYFDLPMTAAEDAILFAPRNRALLGRTLIGKDVNWGSLSSTSDMAFVEDGLRRIQVTDQEGQDGSETTPNPLRTQLLGHRDRIPVEAEKQRALHAQLKAKIRNKNLVFAEVRTKEGNTSYVVTVSPNNESEIITAGAEIGARQDVDGSALDMTVKPGDVKVYGIHTDAVIRQLELAYPDPSAIEAVRIFSLDTIPPGLAGDVFGASARGYPFRSVVSLEPEIAPLSGDDFSLPDAPPSRSSGTVQPAQVDLSTATPIVDGAQAGAYRLGEDYYVKLAGEGTYRVVWDKAHESFRLQPEAKTTNPVADDLPLVRRVAGEFQLVKGTGAMTRSEGTLLDAAALKRDLATNPTPALLRTMKTEGGEVIVVADPSKVSERFEANGRWVLQVDGIKYHRALAEDGNVVFVRETFEDEMSIGCSRLRRATEPLCPAGGGLYIETKNAVTGKDLPPEGTDHPDATGRWVGWVADQRIYGTLKEVSISKGSKTKTYNQAVVPYEGIYQAIRSDRAMPVPLKPDELKALDLPESVPYKPEINASLVRRVRHAAHISFDRIDERLDSKGMLGASIFKKAGTDEEWIVTQYDGQWYIGFFKRAAGAATPTSISLKPIEAAMAERTDPDEAYEEIKRRHAGMQGANFHAKQMSWEKVSEILEQGHHFGVSELEFDGTSYFESATTPEEAYLFDRATRDQVQFRQRASGQWDWQRLDQTSAKPEVEQAKHDMVDIMRELFPQQNIQSIDDVLSFSANKKTPIQAKNFLIFIVNDEEVYLALSGTGVSKTAIPEVFKQSAPGVDGGDPVETVTPVVDTEVNGKKRRLTFVNLDPKIKQYMEAMEASGKYPPPLPSAISPDQLAMKSADFNLLSPRDRDSERLMVAYLEFGGRQADGSGNVGPGPVNSITALNKQNTCRSCFALLQKYFEGKNNVVHFYAREYDKY